MKNDKADRVRKNLVEAAQKTFEKFGFEKSTMMDIATEARKGKSSIYYYFTSKEEIFEAVVKTEAELFKSEVEKALLNVEDIKTKIRIYFTVRMKRFKEVGNLYAAMRSDYLKNLDFVEKIREEYDRDELEFIQDLLKEGVDKEEFEIKNISDTGFALASALKGLEYPLFFNPNDQQLTERIDSLLDILFYGIVKR